jgi:hypothetical protein
VIAEAQAGNSPRLRRYVSGLGKGRQSRVSADVYDEKAAIRGERHTPAGTQEIQIYDIVQIAHHFGVSEIAALYRIRNMRPPLVNDSEFERLKEIVDSGRSKDIRAVLGLPDPEAYWRRKEFRHPHTDLKRRIANYYWKIWGEWWKQKV